MEMELERFSHIQAFYNQAKDYLLSHEAENCLPLRICRNLLRDPDRYGNQVYLAIVKAAKVIAIAIRTPPHPLILSRVENLEALSLMAEDVYAFCREMPGCSGLATEAEAFAQIWQTVTGQRYTLPARRCIYQLHQVQPVPSAKGHLRVATDADRDLIFQWVEAFSLEALGTLEGNWQQITDLNLSRGKFYLWQTEVPVTLVGGMGEAYTPGWIAPVYTPPEYRRRGYATSSVAAVSQQLLERGCYCCFLFTDLKNPTANHIYRTIGYQHICEWHEYEFRDTFETIGIVCQHNCVRQIRSNLLMRL